MAGFCWLRVGYARQLQAIPDKAGENNKTPDVLITADSPGFAMVGATGFEPATS